MTFLPETNLHFHTPERFTNEILFLIEDGLTPMEAVLHYMNKYIIDEDKIAAIMSPVIKEHLRKEGVSKNFLKKRKRLTLLEDDE